MNSENRVLLLTGCINPMGMAQTVLVDTERRKAQYVAAISFYLSKIQLPIIFVENSGCDISEHFTEAIVNERLECLTFKSNYDKERGKGLGESLIIEYALSHSCLLSASSVILKITGRIQIANIKVLLKATPPSQDTIFTDYSTKKGEQNLLKSVIVQAPIDFWKLFLDYKKYINDSQGIYFEHILKYAADKWYTKGHEYTYFPYPILYTGFSGSTGQEYRKKHPYLNWFIKFVLYHLWFKSKIHRSPSISLAAN